jgi:hypothetical protein
VSDRTLRILLAVAISVQGLALLLYLLQRL